MSESNTTEPKQMPQFAQDIADAAQKINESAGDRRTDSGADDTLSLSKLSAIVKTAGDSLTVFLIRDNRSGKGLQTEAEFYVPFGSSIGEVRVPSYRVLEEKTGKHVSYTSPVSFETIRTTLLDISNTHMFDPWVFAQDLDTSSSLGAHNN